MGNQKGLICPYCKTPLQKIPKAKTICKSCKKTIFVRTHFETKGKIYLTEEKLKKYEAEAIEYYNGKENLRKLANIGITEGEIEKEKQELANKFGRQPGSGDIAWGLYNKKLLQLFKQQPIPYHDLKMVYYDMALLKDSEGRDSYESLKQAKKMELLDYKNSGIRKVSILAKESCPQCRQLEGKSYKVEDILENSSLPVKNCQTKLSEKSKGFCRCEYLPVIS